MRVTEQEIRTLSTCQRAESAVRGKHRCTEKLDDAKLIPVRSAITAALSEIKSRVSKQYVMWAAVPLPRPLLDREFRPPGGSSDISYVMFNI